MNLQGLDSEARAALLKGGVSALLKLKSRREAKKENNLKNRRKRRKKSAKVKKNSSLKP